MRVLTLITPTAAFLLNQPAPTPGAQAVKAKVIEIRPFPDDGMLGEVICKSESSEDLIIVHVAETDGGCAFVETKMTQAEYNAELAKALGGSDAETPADAPS